MKRIPVTILAARTIANLSLPLLQELGCRQTQAAIALLATDCDDATYIALDEATKRANVEVIYARSLYAGAANATNPLAGEVIGILAGPTPDEVESGLAAAVECLQGVGFCTADEAGKVAYLAHTVARTGTFLAQQAGIAPGQALAYLIAPPVPAILGLDAALKAADVRFGTFYRPPSETNFAGALLTGTQSACYAACRAFAQAIEEAAARPCSIQEEYHGI